MDGSNPLTAVERLFMEAGYSRTFYLLWRMSTLSSLKFASRLARVSSCWLSEALDDDDAEELKLAKQWLAGESRRAAANQNKEAAEKKVMESEAHPGPHYGPPMTTSEAKALIQEEIEAGRPVTLKAFENALRRAAKTARECPEELPLQLGGQHADWELVKLGSEAGGHGNGHLLRRRRPRSASQTPQARPWSQSRLHSSLLKANTAATWGGVSGTRRELEGGNQSAEHSAWETAADKRAPLITRKASENNGG